MKKGREAPFFDFATELTVADVHRHFKAKTHFGHFRLGPHGSIPFHQVELQGFALGVACTTEPNEYCKSARESMTAFCARRRKINLPAIMNKTS